MPEIPSANETDAEDVVWGLQTAEALWKRGDRVEAVAWVRRAAQAASEAADYSRARELARSATALATSMARAPSTRPPSTRRPSSLPPPSRPPLSRRPPSAGSEDKMPVTARGIGPSPVGPASARPPPLPSRRRPPPLPKFESIDDDDVITSVSTHEAAQILADETVRKAGRVSGAPAAAAARASAAVLSFNLDDVEAFADLPDDVRADFAHAATVKDFAEGEEVRNFALAIVLGGAFDVAATMVDAPAVRLEKEAVLRARGTTQEGVPMRLICVHATGRLATWSDAAVQGAFRTVPWVEEELRALADRVQALVGITLGPLGQRFDASIREQIVGRLQVRSLLPGEVLLEAGLPVPGLLIVGVGELELVGDSGVVGTVGSGEFVFPGEVLSAGVASVTARAGAGGALVMCSDRALAQELLATWPPLVEMLAGM